LGENDSSFRGQEFLASDGYRWRYRQYTPSGTPRACVVCIHGIQSHAGWYEHSCRQLSAVGLAVSFLDRRGSGMNTEARGDAPSFRRLLDDLAEYLRPLRQGNGGSPLPVVLVAISWGGKLGVALQRRHPGLVDALALLCPGFFPKVRPSFGQRLAILASRLVAPRQLFPIPLNEPELFTATPRWQKFIREDELGLRQATARLLVESVRLDGYLRLVPRFVRVPVLLMLAQEDRIIANEPTRRFVARFATPDREVIEYPGAQHTLEFEPVPDQFIMDLEQWIGRKLAPIPPDR
jgi:alpha-beta hydrolase superfamily lysophospholipase